MDRTAGVDFVVDFLFSKQFALSLVVVQGTSANRGREGVEMNDDRRRGSVGAPEDRAGLIDYLRRAIAPSRKVDPTIEFYLQLAIKQLSEDLPVQSEEGDREDPEENG
jgi:hypothetical protein